MAKKGEPVFLALVRGIDQPMERKKTTHAKAIQHKPKLQPGGPKKDFATVDARKEEILQQIDPDHQQQLTRYY